MKEIEPLHPDLPQIITHSIGNASNEKISGVITSYDVLGHHLIGGFISGQLIAVIGLYIEDGHGVIRHIAVHDGHRNQGIGMRIITYVLEFFSLQNLTAETDDEARRFYEKCGFSCQSFEGVYGQRYTCSYHR